MTVGHYASYIPSPPQGVWELGPLTIRAYAICILLGVVVAVWWSARRYARAGHDGGVVVDAAILAVPVGIIGARLYHVATDWPKYFGPGADPLDALKIWQGGLGIWGGIAAGALAVVVLLRRKGIAIGPFADAVAPAIPLAQAIGRFGNYFNQELYGAPTDLPWGLAIYQRVDELGRISPVMGRSTGEILTIVHPTFLYEAVWNLLVVLLIMWLSKRGYFTGKLFAVYVAGYTAGRFVIEQMRVDEATLIAGIRINVFVAAAVCVLALVVLFWPSRVRAADTQARENGTD